MLNKKIFLPLILSAASFSTVAFANNPEDVPFYNNNQQALANNDVIQFEVCYNPPGGGCPASNDVPATGTNYTIIGLGSYPQGTAQNVNYDIYIRDVTANSAYQKCGGGSYSIYDPNEDMPTKIVAFDDGKTFQCASYF